jgi:hypothetical protein
VHLKELCPWKALWCLHRRYLGAFDGVMSVEGTVVVVLKKECREGTEVSFL